MIEIFYNLKLFKDAVKSAIMREINSNRDSAILNKFLEAINTEKPEVCACR